jgi:hypothetical protein
MRGGSSALYRSCFGGFGRYQYQDFSLRKSAMCTFNKSIAFAAAAFAIVCSLANAEPTRTPATTASTTSPLFADSFGLNGTERASATKHQASLSPSEQGLMPAADSFGLNNPLVSAFADCSAAKSAKPVARSHRCIEI